MGKKKVNQYFTCPYCHRSYKTKEEAEKCLALCEQNNKLIYVLYFEYNFNDGCYTSSVFSKYVNKRDYDEELHSTRISIMYNKIEITIQSSEMSKRIAGKLVAQSKRMIAEKLSSIRKSILEINTKDIVKHTDFPVERNDDK